MLKVKTTKQKTIDPKDLTDSHFIIVQCPRWKGVVIKLPSCYIISNVTESSNEYTAYQYVSIKEIVAKANVHDWDVFATLDYQEFKDWFFKQ